MNTNAGAELLPTVLWPEVDDADSFDDTQLTETDVTNGDGGKRTFNPVWVSIGVSILVGLISGIVTWGAIMISIGEYKNKVETLESTTKAYMEFMGRASYSAGEQSQVNSRILSALEKMEARLDAHINNTNGGVNR